ncbi:MAG: hypothetical protein HC800_00225 [Phormidesmis sp. RL_2_1]|nr:hypothetical protein [Phormidesmis sp. RL_2_1]
MTEWLPNCYGVTLTVSENPGAIVFQFVGSAWTTVSDVIHYSRALFEGTVAQNISERLSTEVIDCSYSADEGSFYATYNLGEVTERLNFRETKIRGYEDTDDVDEVLDRLIETGEEVISDSYYEYFNASQNIDDLLVLYDYDVMQNMLVEKEAYLPLILWPTNCAAGDTLNLVIRGLKENDFERIDFITIDNS